MTDKQYLFTSSRLGFRTWVDDDVLFMTDINQDVEVMKYFPCLQSEQETYGFIVRMNLQFVEKGFCYFAVDQLVEKTFIGFIGLSLQTFESDFTPCVDIGWRLKRSVWNMGYATEGAERCIQFAFADLMLDKIYAMCPVFNLPSENVMRKIGMIKVKTFVHPKIPVDSALKECVLYEISNTI